jgi:hypothetical protein
MLPIRSLTLDVPLQSCQLIAIASSFSDCSMKLPSEQAKIILDQVRKIIDRVDAPYEMRLLNLWNTLLYIQASSLAAALRATVGTHVYSGPFKGMDLTPAILCQAYAPILLGTYEHELHPAIEAMIIKPFRTILNIGCGFGYYSVGLALRMSNTTVLGFDINEGEQQRSRDLAGLNDVQDRVKISGVFDGADFARYADQKTLVVMDIEGAEGDLLDPARYPALQKMDVIVELHDVYRKGISKIVSERFKATHDIEIIRNTPTMFDLAKLVGPDIYIDPTHSLVATWEHRDGETPWAVMQSNVS